MITLFIPAWRKNRNTYRINMEKQFTKTSMVDLADKIKTWAFELGFQQTGITGTDLSEDEAHLLNWLDKKMHGEMSYMQRHGIKRSRPGDLLPGTVRIISTRMDYQPADALHSSQVLSNNKLAYVSRYAVGRDYHKVVRRRLQKLASRISG